ncbi:MAG: L-threonylcarbamoyladenylate synthase [Acidimicrobiales bacterium]
MVLTLTGETAHDRSAIEHAADVLRGGGLVAFPTETVYGLGALARSPEAVAGIFAAKGRPSTDPLIVHVLADWPLDEIFDLADPVPGLGNGADDELTDELIAAHWPGPLTIVRDKHHSIPDIVTAGGSTVAVRAPAHPVAQALLAAVGEPIAAPSANRFSYISATTAAHVVADLGDAVDLVLDGGPATAGIESTVVRIDGDVLIVLRHGALGIDALTAAIDRGVDVVVPAPDTATDQSPGRLVRHYAPATAAVACPAGTTPPDDLDRPVCYVGYHDALPPLPSHWAFRDLGPIEDLDAVAAGLYTALRELDDGAFATLVLQLTGRDGLGAAIDDRLRRSASGRVL